jgi:hypothetical protein
MPIPESYSAVEISKIASKNAPDIGIVTAASDIGQRNLQGEAPAFTHDPMPPPPAGLPVKAQRRERSSIT